MQDFTYYNGKLCVSANWLMTHIVTPYSYKYHVRKDNFKRLRRGGGADNPALIEYDSIRPEKYKLLIRDVLGMDPYSYVKRQAFQNSIIPDPQAREFFARELKEDRNAAKKLPVLVANAEILNAAIRLYNNRRAYRRKLGGSTNDIWETISKEVNAVDKNIYPHSLPSSKDALRKKATEYKKNSYVVLLHGNRGNQYRKKRNDKIDYLIINLYTMMTKPYAEWVHQMYENFRAGKLSIVDKATGELFDHTDPAYKPISPGTVWNIVKDKQYDALIAKLRDGDYEYSQRHRPHHHRTKPVYSLSKISLDDRDIMHTKLPDGTALKAYYVYDVMSNAIIGRAYNRKKTEQIFIDTIKDMFLFLKRNRIGLPLEAEVENHLVKGFKDTLMTIFPFVRWANPANSQEKFAETGIRLKKYGPEKRNNPYVGRHYGKGANKVTKQKIFDEENNNYKTRTGTFEELVANDKAEIEAFNNQLHPDQKRFPGKTLIQVFMENLNPDLPDLPEYLFAQYVGVPVTTSIRRNSYIKALNTEFMLKDFDILSKLAPNNTNVTGYYIPDENGEVERLYLYQNNKYIGDAVNIPRYNTAKAEWTDKDAENYTKQAKYLSQFDKFIKDKKEKATRVAVLPNEPEHYESEPEIIGSISDEPEEPVFDAGYQKDWANAAVNDM